MPSLESNGCRGELAAGFEPVFEAFAATVSAPGQLGAACTVLRNGRPILDMYGGWKDLECSEPWQHDTPLLVYSLTKGMTGLACAIAVSRGLFAYDEPVIALWPEFGAHGKDSVTVGQLLSEQAGLASIDLDLDAANMGDQTLLAGTLAGQRPDWVPGDYAGNHAFTIGWLASEVIRRRDPAGRTLGKFFHEEIAAPLGVEFWIGLPDSFPSERLARIRSFSMADLLIHRNGFSRDMLLSLLWPWSLTFRTLNDPMLWHGAAQLDAPPYRHLELGGVGGIGTAPALAAIYAEFAAGGRRIGLDPQVFAALCKGFPPPRRGIYDQVLKRDVYYSLGLEKPCAGWEYSPADSAFGAFAIGGSLAFADPENGLGYVWVTNRHGLYFWDDPRELAVRTALFRCLREM